VILPVFNAERYIAETLESVLAQTHEQWELLLVEDGSTDGSAAIVADYAAREPARITLLRHENGSNRGVSCSRNLALGAARGALVAFLDADDVWLPEKLAAQVACMAAHREVGVCYCRSQVLREGAGHDWMPGTVILGHEPTDDCRVTVMKIITVRLNYAFSSVMARTAAVRAVGGFAENLPFQSEDRIMLAKVAADHRFWLVPEVLCRYRAHGTSYTAEVVRERKAPAVFFDMQVRIMKWLRSRPDRRGWARQIAHDFVPVSFVRASQCSLNARVLAVVLKAFMGSVLLYPSIPVRLLWRIVRFPFRRGGLAQALDLMRRSATYRRLRARGKERVGR